MKRGTGFRDRIMRANLKVIAPVMAFFAAAAFGISYSYVLGAQVRSLTSQSYISQVYLMNRLSAAGSWEEQQNELLLLAPSFSNTLADASGARVQILLPGMEVIGDSNIPDDIRLTPDVKSAAEGTKAYKFFYRGIHPHISFSSPIYAEEKTIGVIRFLERESSFLFSWRPFFSFLFLWGLSVAAWYAAGGLLNEKLSAPLELLSDTVRKMEAGEEVELNTVPMKGEVRDIARAYAAIQEANTQNLIQLAEERERQSLFFSSATHQLKTPLTSIIGYSQIIARMSGDEEVRESARYIEQAGKSLLKMAESMLDISRYRHSSYEYTPSWFSLDDLCRECIGLVQPRLEKNGITLENRCKVVRVYFDRHCVREVLLNILDNCILHSGCDSIVLRSDTLPVRLMIEDNGKGMDSVQASQIFEPFYRSTGSVSKGSGLGLAICREMMTGQGGNITVESEPGQGSRFIMYFQDKDQPHKWIGNMARRI